MKKEFKLKTNYFYGNKISDYGIENKRLDYGTLAKSFDCVLNNDIIQNTQAIGYWDIVSGELFWEDEDGYEYDIEIYQYYIVSSSGFEILQELDEIVFYNEELDMYVWGVTHYGTSWDYVLTSIEIEGSDDD